MMILRRIFEQTEGENRVKIAYEQIVEKSVNVELIGWTSMAFGGAAYGNSWAITFSGADQCRLVVYNPPLIPRPLTGSTKRSYPDAEFFHSRG
jgi:hypothetical protein